MKQQLRVGFYVNGVSVKEPDPRALIFKPVYKPMINGLRQKEKMEFDWCNINDLSHLNMANN